MDKVVAGGAVGTVAGIMGGIISRVLFGLNVGKLCLVEIGRGIFFQKEMPGITDSFSWHVLGWVAHLAMSIMLGIVFVYLLHYTGRDYALLKGAMLGVIVWYVNIGIISPLAVYTPLPLDAFSLLLMLAYHVIFGLISAWLIVWWEKKQLPSS